MAPGARRLNNAGPNSSGGTRKHPLECARARRPCNVTCRIATQFRNVLGHGAGGPLGAVGRVPPVIADGVDIATRRLQRFRHIDDARPRGVVEGCAALAIQAINVRLRIDEDGDHGGAPQPNVRSVGCE